MILMKISKLHYITNGSSEIEILAEVKAVIDAGCNWVQLRIKNKELDFLAIAEKVKAICLNKATFLINDNVDIAQKINVDGVHLGLSDMEIPLARQILGPHKIIGGTANTKANCLMHQKKGADYIGLGPFRTTKTKKKLSPLLGIEGYQAILPSHGSEITIPVLAIGGIQLSDIKGLMNDTGIHGIAVSGLIANTIKKKVIVDSLKEELNKDKTRSIA
jgi:thiamine-phosphate pyrophosphorylase